MGAAGCSHCDDCTVCNPHSGLIYVSDIEHLLPPMPPAPASSLNSPHSPGVVVVAGERARGSRANSRGHSRGTPAPAPAPVVTEVGPSAETGTPAAVSADERRRSGASVGTAAALQGRRGPVLRPGQQDSSRVVLPPMQEVTEDSEDAEVRADEFGSDFAGTFENNTAKSGLYSGPTDTDFSDSYGTNGNLSWERASTPTDQEQLYREADEASRTRGFSADENRYYTDDRCALFNGEAANGYAEVGTGSARLSGQDLAVTFLLPDASLRLVHFDRQESKLGIDFSNYLPLTVRGLKPGGHGEKLGVQKGWMIHSINGESSDGLTLPEVLALIKHAMGT
eukprot:TRINITY_DN38599_c0_g2_i1.p1 TRINITY_DN38599_c0_g2~~TRINITY_DN38599_c0_g2_i1.p1  ORF type:complete len:385 (-),score=33.75 TRINITY_DN38599_c0_g2_i1:83-1096(-)